MSDQVNPNDMSTKTDVDLIQLIGSSGIQDAAGKNALAELYHRYSEGLYAHCVKVHGGRFESRAAIRAFVGDVFIAFRTSAARFDPGYAKSPSDVPRLIRAWLAKKAQWLLANRDVESEVLAASDAELDLSQVPSSPKRQKRSRGHVACLRQLRLLLHTLPEKARDVLTTSFSYYDVEIEDFRVPDAVQNDLCNRWAIPTRNAYVKYRTRQIEFLKTKLGAKALVA